MSSSTPSDARTSNALHSSSSKPDFTSKSSCGDLQSRLKVRRVLGVGDTSGSICSSKISQILGQSDHFIYQLPSNLATWLLLTTIYFSCLTLLGIFWPSCLRLLLPGKSESSLHLAASYAFFSTMLGLTLRSGDKISLQLVLFSLTIFHTLSFLFNLWIFQQTNSKFSSIIAVILHLLSLIINFHFYSTITPSLRHKKFKTFLQSFSFSTTDYSTGLDSS